MNTLCPRSLQEKSFFNEDISFIKCFTMKRLSPYSGDFNGKALPWSFCLYGSSGEIGRGLFPTSRRLPSFSGIFLTFGAFSRFINKVFPFHFSTYSWRFLHEGSLHFSPALLLIEPFLRRRVASLPVSWHILCEGQGETEEGYLDDSHLFVKTDRDS
jgi:hypothetical protein